MQKQREQELLKDPGLTLTALKPLIVTINNYSRLLRLEHLEHQPAPGSILS